MSDELNIEPENKTECSSTGEGHVWIWDKEQDDWQCDECGVWESQQE